jgi:hypothetical protein
MITTGDTAGNADRFGVRPFSLTRVAAFVRRVERRIRRFTGGRVAATARDPDVGVAGIGQCAGWLLCANCAPVNAFIRTMINRGRVEGPASRAGLSSQYGSVFDPRR